MSRESYEDPMKNKTPYHPHYGLPDTLRFRAIRDAVETSVRESADKNRVHQSTVYKWMRDIENDVALKHTGGLA
jgi:hypothetical protein